MDTSSAFPVLYASKVQETARSYELLGFAPTFQLPAEGEQGYVSAYARRLRAREVSSRLTPAAPRRDRWT